MWGVVEQHGARFIKTSLQSLRSFAAEPWSAIQQRGVISVDVYGNRGDKALRMLKKKVLEEGFKETWAAQSVYMKPSQKRVLAERETKKRLDKRVFREKLRWIMRRSARGF